MSAAQNIADRIEAQAIAGQDAAQPFLDRAAQLSAPGAFQEFMSPYQQEVIDTTRQELERQLQAQQAQLGASAGAAFGGGRFGVAQGELGARGATGIAQTLAGLRQQGFGQAQQAAANALQQQLALGQAAQGQAGQNLALLGSGLQSQLAGAQAALTKPALFTTFLKIQKNHPISANSLVEKMQEATPAALASAEKSPFN